MVVDPASDWPLFAEKARQLLAQENVEELGDCAKPSSRGAGCDSDFDCTPVSATAT